MKKNIAGKIYRKDGTTPHFGSVSDSDRYAFSEIINGCREYIPSSQEKLYKKYYGYAVGVALTYCSKREDAVEVVNDSFIKVFKHIKTYNPSEPFKPWLRRILINTSIDKARSNKRFDYHIEIDDAEQISATDIEAELNAKQIYTLLNELPDLLRYVFNMYEVEGYSHREIAERLLIAESSSRTYLVRAKNQLRELYQNFFMEEK